MLANKLLKNQTFSIWEQFHFSAAFGAVIGAWRLSAATPDEFPPWGSRRWRRTAGMCAKPSLWLFPRTLALALPNRTPPRTIPSKTAFRAIRAEGRTLGSAQRKAKPSSRYSRICHTKRHAQTPDRRAAPQGRGPTRSPWASMGSGVERISRAAWPSSR
jgi:hypothetical protein